MGDFDSDLRERLRGLVSTEEPSKGSWEGIEAQLRGSHGVASAGSRTRALAAVAVVLVVAASVLVMRQVSDGEQRVAVGPVAPDTTTELPLAPAREGRERPGS